MRFTPEKGSTTVIDAPFFALGPVDQTVWCYDGGTAWVVAVGARKVSANKPSGLPYAIEYTPPALPPRMPPQAVQRASEILERHRTYLRATDPYLMRVQPLPLPHAVLPVSDAERQAAETIMDAHRAHNAALDDIAELQSKRQAIGAAAFLELIKREGIDHGSQDDETTD